MKTLFINVPEHDTQYELLIGRNKAENDMILRSSLPDDMWFHLEDISGPHFVLKCNSEAIPKKYYKYIGTLFRQFKANLPPRYSVIYTSVKEITFTKIPGTVLTKNTKVLKYNS
jgi:predicted ribosome quality control (RQC) complex YloA/Tae2 family protein